MSKVDEALAEINAALAAMAPAHEGLRDYSACPAQSSLTGRCQCSASSSGRSTGRVVNYVLNAKAETEILRRRTNADGIAGRIAEGTWPLGAQAHIGNAVLDGDTLAAFVVKVHPDDSVNLKVMLDGTDFYWVEGAVLDEAKAPGTWHWIPKS